MGGGRAALCEKRIWHLSVWGRWAPFEGLGHALAVGRLGETAKSPAAMLLAGLVGPWPHAVGSWQSSPAPR